MSNDEGKEEVEVDYDGCLIAVSEDFKVLAKLPCGCSVMQDFSDVRKDCAQLTDDEFYNLVVEEGTKYMLNGGAFHHKCKARSYH